MKAAAVSKFAFFPSFAGFGLAAKVVVGIFVIATAAGGAFYVFSQKTYAPKTIHFDGRDFYLISERDGDTGEVINIDNDANGGTRYVAGYSDIAAPQTGDNLRLLFDQTYYAANPAPAFVRDGAYSAVARLKNLWGGGNSDSYLRDEIREEDDSIYKLFAWKTAPRENGDVLIRTTGIKCGASRKNAYRCITYNSWMPPGTDAEGAAELERIYDLLAEYPLSHNEELLSDMAAAAR